VLKRGFTGWAKTYNFREVTVVLCCFMFLFVCIFISYLVVCTVLLFVMFVREVLVLLYRSLLFVVRVSYCVIFLLTLDGLRFKSVKYYLLLVVIS
jgi:hypothetical protein